MSESSVTIDRNLGARYFSKPDGCLYQTVVKRRDSNGLPTETEDVLVSNDFLSAKAAMTLEQYKEVDKTITSIRNNPERFSAWLRSLSGNVLNIDGMSRMNFYYKYRKNGTLTSRPTMNLTDDAPGTSFDIAEDGICLPLEFADWTTSIREDATASLASGVDIPAERAALAAESVAEGVDFRQINGWKKLSHRGQKVYGFRDMGDPDIIGANGQVTAHGLVPTSSAYTDIGWYSLGKKTTGAATATSIYNDISDMVQKMDDNEIPGPFVLLLPKKLRKIMAATYSTNQLTNVEKSLYTKILEAPTSGVPNVLNISSIKFVDWFDKNIPTDSTTVSGTTYNKPEAYLLSMSPEYFRVLNYLPMTSFMMDLKGTIVTKHRVAEGLCPLFKHNGENKYGIVTLAAGISNSGNGVYA